ncbi:acyl-CoA synthetase, partial [Streptomyces sp. NPDC088184]
TPDPHWGEAVTATVVLRPGQQATPADLTDHVRARKGSLWAPKLLHLADSLPLTALGKIDKKKLRNQP